MRPSPSPLRGAVHFVIANAGIVRKDDVFTFDGIHTLQTSHSLSLTAIPGRDQEPVKPNLSIIDVNLCGALYTVKLSLHYFVKQNGTDVSPQQVDTCLVLIGSGAAFLDCPRGPRYSSTKWAMRVSCMQ